MIKEEDLHKFPYRITMEAQQLKDFIILSNWVRDNFPSETYQEVVRHNFYTIITNNDNQIYFRLAFSMDGVAWMVHKVDNRFKDYFREIAKKRIPEGKRTEKSDHYFVIDSKEGYEILFSGEPIKRK